MTVPFRGEGIPHHARDGRSDGGNIGFPETLQKAEASVFSFSVQTQTKTREHWKSRAVPARNFEEVQETLWLSPQEENICPKCKYDREAPGMRTVWVSA